MDVIDKYLAAHSRYVEAVAALDAIGTLARDVGEQLLAAPHNVKVEGEAVTVLNPVNRRGDEPAPPSWPKPGEIKEALERFLAAKEELVAEGEALVTEKGPAGLKGRTLPSG